MTDDEPNLHRLALDYRTARLPNEVQMAWEVLEAYTCAADRAGPRRGHRGPARPGRPRGPRGHRLTCIGKRAKACTRRQDAHREGA